MTRGAPAELNAEDIAAIGRLAGEVRLGEGEPLGPGGLGLVLEGKMEISRPTEFPERRVVMGILGPGAIVGETSFFGGEEFTLVTRAMEPSRILFIGREAFTRLAEENPGVHQKLLFAALRALSIRLFKSYERISSVF